MKVAYLCRYDTRDIKSWSGTGYFIPKTLEELGFEVGRIDNLPFASWKSTLYAKWVRRILRQPYYPDRTQNSVRLTSEVAQSRLREFDPDVIFTTQFPPISFLETKKPIVFWNDAAYTQLLGFYHAIPGTRHLNEIKALEKLAFDKAAALVFSSDWAARGAQELYGIDANKLHVIPFGLNSLERPAPVERTIDAKVRLLIVGVEWHRKGIDLACELTRKMRADGIDCELHIVGCKPENADALVAEGGFHLHGFLSKGNESDRAKLNKIYSDSHIFLLPSRADCTPMVVAEANSHCMPTICSDVGGMATVVDPPFGGDVFPIETWVEQSARRVREYLDHPDQYAKACKTAHANFQNRLTWESAGSKIKDLLLKVAAK